MKRREFLSLSLISAMALQVPRVSGEILAQDIKNEPLDIKRLLSFLDSLQVESLVTEGEWDLGQIFNHAAQSIEFSIDGYPQHKSDFFKQTVGALAFQGFALWGKMTHGLAEGIPGAKSISVSQDPYQGLARLKQSLLRFDQYQGDLQPHFAYGNLTKQEYALAHVLHLNNHFEEIRLVQTA